MKIKHTVSVLCRAELQCGCKRMCCITLRLLSCWEKINNNSRCVKDKLKLHTHECTQTHRCARAYVHTTESSHVHLLSYIFIITTNVIPPTDFNAAHCVRQSSSQLYQVSVIFLTDQPCQREHWAPCCTPAWTPHPSHYTVGLRPAFLQHPSFYVSLSIHNTSIYGIQQIHHSEYSVYPFPPFCPPPPLILV